MSNHVATTATGKFLHTTKNKNNNSGGFLAAAVDDDNLRVQNFTRTGKTAALRTLLYDGNRRRRC